MQKILIVEDEESQIKILRDNLTKAGFSIIEARNGVEGLKMALQEHPDLILLDVRMPKMDGMAMMHRLRQNSWGEKASIVILTNYDASDAQMFQITVDQPSYYLIKADSPLEKIIEKIQEILDSKKEENQ